MPKERGNGEGSWRKIERNGKKFYQYRFSFKLPNGSSKQVSFYGEGKEDCREKKREYEKKNCLSDVKTVTEWANFWLLTYKKESVSDKWYDYLKLVVEKYIIPELGLLKLDEVKPMHIKALVKKVASKSLSFQQKLRNTCHNMFEDALENNYCSSNPCRKIEITAKEKRSQKDKCFTNGESKAILSYAKKNPSKVGKMISLLFYTGLRRGELLGLKWSDIDLKDNIINLNRGVIIKDGKKDISEYLKSEESKSVVPLSKDAKRIIKQTPNESEFLFVSDKDKQYMSPNCFCNEFKRYLENLNKHLIEKNKPALRVLTPHACRHTAGTRLIDSGVDIRVVQEILRHTSIKTTSKYTHPDNAKLKLEIDKLKY